MEQNNIIDTASYIFVNLKKSLIWILPLSFLFGVVFGFIEKQKKPIYEVSSKIFPLSTGGGSSPLSDFKAQFGISDGGDVSKLYNISELISSKTISQNIVNAPVNNKHRKLAYWILADENYNTPFWKKKINLAKLDSNEVIYLSSGLLGFKANVSTAKSDFTTIKTYAYNEDLCIEMNRAILKELSDFYIKSKTEKAREDLFKLGRLKDSVGRNVNMVENAIAGNADATRYISGLSASLPQLKLQRLQEEYLEQYKSVTIAQQNAKFKLLSESPIFQILDQPIKPLNMIYPSWKKHLAIGFVVSFFLLSLIALRKELWAIVINELKKA